MQTPTSEAAWREQNDPAAYELGVHDRSEDTKEPDGTVVFIERVYVSRFVEYVTGAGVAVDPLFLDSMRARTAGDPDELLELWMSQADADTFIAITNMLERAEVAAAIAEAKALMRCRVCGVVMDEQNTLTTDIPDECVDCLEAEGIFARW